jgi:hypothetical protein
VIPTELEEEWGEVAVVVRDEGVKANYSGNFLTG